MSTHTKVSNDCIRPFEAGDYEALAELDRALYPDHAGSAREIRFNDEHKDPKVTWRRWVWDEDSRIRAQAGFSQEAYAFHPRRFRVWIQVHPDFQRRGIGTALWEHLRRELAPFDPIKLQAETGELHPRGIEFAAKLGFEKELEEIESRLDLTRFEPGQFGDALEKVMGQGIGFRSHGELASREDHMPKLYELVTTLDKDVPWPDPYTKPEYELWSKRMLENPNLLPEGYIIALDGERYVGLSNLWNAEALPDVWTGLTGVLREYRGRGIAMALKVNVLDWAKEAGILGVRTWNAEENASMRGINRLLGFEPLPAWYTCAKIIKEEEKSMKETATGIRVHCENDYEALAEIHNVLFPEFPETAGEIAHYDEQRRKDELDPDKPIKWKRFSWEENGRVVAAGNYNQSPWMYHPRKFEVWVMVHPDFQRRGIGGRLFERILEDVMAFDPIKLSSWTCPEKVPQSVGFLESRGFKSGMKVWDSKLTLDDWDPAPFAEAVTRVEEQGIRLVDMVTLRGMFGDWDRRIYEMEQEVWKDIPLPDPHTDPGFEWYRRHVLESPNLYPEASWFAVDGDRPVGLSALWKQKAGHHLATGLTGVSRSHRKRGIAMALKVKALSYAKSKDHPWVMTDNEENNVGMIGINKRLGFRDYPSWRGYEKVLKEEQ